MGFNEKIWQLCKRIPKGKVTTYKEIAAAMKTKAYRAVGNALNKNPYGAMSRSSKGKMVPCHRVVGSDGSLVGFAHGLNAKEKLLQREGIKIKKGKITNFDKILYRF